MVYIIIHTCVQLEASFQPAVIVITGARGSCLLWDWPGPLLTDSKRRRERELFTIFCLTVQVKVLLNCIYFQIFHLVILVLCI